MLLQTKREEWGLFDFTRRLRVFYRGCGTIPPADHRQSTVKGNHMRAYTAVVERCPDTGLYVGYVPGFPGAHSQGESMDELAENLKEVIEMIIEEGEPKLETEFVGTQNVVVA